MKRPFHNRASRDVRPRRQSAARRSVVLPGERLGRVGRVGRVEGDFANVISQYDYTYDAIGRRIEIARSGSAMSESRTDSYGYNIRNELTSASKLGGTASVPSTTEYAYQYDDIGNRITSADITTNRIYTANNLNQYTSISNSASSASPRETFIPQFDADGNQTLIQTSTGIWQVQYNGENRAIYTHA